MKKCTSFVFGAILAVCMVRETAMAQGPSPDPARLASVIRANAVDPLTWEDCVRLAAKHNPALIAAREQVAAAEAGIRAARSAMLPQLSIGTSAEYGEQSGSETDGDTSYGASLSVGQSLYSGGENHAKVRAAEAGLDKAKAGANGTSADRTYDLRSAFVELLHAQEQLDLLRKIEERRKDNLELVDLRYEGGREHKGSLALSQAAFYEAAVDVGQAEREVKVARQTLMRTIGMEGEAGALSVTGKLQTTPAPEISDWGRKARETPEYAQTLAEKSAAEAQVESARSGYLPDLSLNGSAGRYRDEDAFEDDRWSVGLKLTFPFWSGGGSKYEYQQAKANLREAEANLTDTLNTEAKDLAETLMTFENAVETVSVREKFIEASEVRAAIARQQYEDGLLSFENWDLIENDLIANRKHLLDAQKAAILAEAAWWKKSGHGVF